MFVQKKSMHETSCCYTMPLCFHQWHYFSFSCLIRLRAVFKPQVDRLPQYLALSSLIDMYMYVDIDRLTEELDIEIPLF